MHCKTQQNVLNVTDQEKKQITKAFKLAKQQNKFIKFHTSMETAVKANSAIVHKITKKSKLLSDEEDKKQ